MKLHAKPSNHGYTNMPLMNAAFVVSRLVDEEAEQHAYRALKAHPGVEDVLLDHTNNEIVVLYDSSQITAIEVEHAVTRLGILVISREDRVHRL